MGSERECLCRVRSGEKEERDKDASEVFNKLRADLDLRFFVRSIGVTDNPHGLGKTVTELRVMIKLHEQTLPKKYIAPALRNIRARKVQKKNKNKKPQLAARGNNQGKGKSKLAYAPKPKIPPPPKKENPAKNSICHQCCDTGHWMRNCHQYLAELQKNKRLSQGTSALDLLGSDVQIWNRIKGTLNPPPPRYGMKFHQIMSCIKVQHILCLDLLLRCAHMESDKKGSEAVMAENTIQVGLPRQVTGRFSPIIE
ncbi:zinc finger, CCHC-type containing protein [Tanacetum coccineum]